MSQGVAAAGDLPPEILLHILAFATAGRLQTVEATTAAKRGRRNDLLLQTVLVCRAWAVVSQHLLLLDVYVGSVTHPATDSRPEETLSIQPFLDSLATLPAARKDHIRSLHLEMGSGFALPILNRYLGPGAPIMISDTIATHVQWASPDQLRQVLSYCPNLQHLGLSIADPQRYDPSRIFVAGDPIPGLAVADMTPLHRLRSLSFTWKTDSFQDRVTSVQDILADLLSLTPNLEYLHVDTHYGHRFPYLDADDTRTLFLPHLRELRAVERLPMFILNATMPSLHTLVWRNPEASQMGLLLRFTALDSLAISGDWHQALPDFARLPQLRNFLVDGSDHWANSSFWDAHYQQTGVQNKSRYLRSVLEAIPRTLDSFTLVESLSLRLVPRDALFEILNTWASDSRLPRGFQLLYELGSVPPSFKGTIAQRPLFEEPAFQELKATLSRKDIEVDTGMIQSPFKDLFRQPGVY
ncbi:hypothetical protein AURDEDRAFT_145157 [Auricularia subglabra TFB-10046 SS5]|nr:hypothetical protein AURDEDRAFT_145157 [Auricularia subglabra TFB-10046 SS5]